MRSRNYSIKFKNENETHIHIRNSTLMQTANEKHVYDPNSFEFSYWKYSKFLLYRNLIHLVFSLTFSFSISEK